MKSYLLGHDIGTSGDKAALFDTEGNLIASYTSHYETYYEGSGYVEQDPEEWWRAFCYSTRNLINNTGIDAGDIAGISFSGQMLGCTCIDKSGKVLRRSIIWADQRAQAQQREISSKISAEEYYRITGHPLTASYGLLKLLWIKENENSVYKNTWKALNSKDYIAYRLTGNAITDYSDACGFGFYNLIKNQWDEELLKLTEIDKDKLPSPCSAVTNVGVVTKEAAELTGLKEGTPVIIGSGDGVAANVGAGSIAPGNGYICLGTSGWISITSNKPLFDKELRTVTWPHMVPGLYAPNGTMQYAAGCYQWIKNIFTEKFHESRESLSSYEKMNLKVAESDVGAKDLIFLPYLLGERAPLWNPDAKGCWIGLTPETTEADIFRSVIEGVSMHYSLIRDVLDPEHKLGELTLIGGGAKGDVWRNTLSDVMNVCIKVPQILEEAGTIGAAVCAGVGAGIYKDFSAVKRFNNISDIREANQKNYSVYKGKSKVFKASYEAMKPVFLMLGEGRFK